MPDYATLVAGVRDGASLEEIAGALERSPIPVLERSRRVLPVAEQGGVRDRVLPALRRLGTIAEALIGSGGEQDRDVLCTMFDAVDDYAIWKGLEGRRARRLLFHARFAFTQDQADYEAERCMGRVRGWVERGLDRQDGPPCRRRWPGAVGRTRLGGSGSRTTWGGCHPGTTPIRTRTPRWTLLSAGPQVCRRVGTQS
ncbi:hypothetical protein BH24ACT8_BH24ACT8_07310 [soil metagenome]